MAGFKCPFCGEIMSISSETLVEYKLNFNQVSHSYNSINHPYLEVLIYRCPNDECQEETILAAGKKNYIQGKKVSIYPEAIFQNFPDYVPESIRSDYEEACTICEKSPKAAATLARRCLQGMIHDFWNIHEKNLNAEITELKQHVPAAQWKAIDSVRSIGNISAHMEHDVNLIIDVNTDEASALLKLIEHLISKWYIDRHESEELYQDVAAIGAKKQESRDK